MFDINNTDTIQEIYYENVKELYQDLSPFGKYAGVLNNFIFRGESSSKYKLIPSALREHNKKSIYSLAEIYNLSGVTGNEDEFEYWQQYAELQTLKKFFKISDDRGLSIPDVPILREEILNVLSKDYKVAETEYWLPDELLEIAGLAQHYGVPTRFIDWSLDYNISLYFAAVGAMKQESFKDDDYMVLWALDYKHIEFLKESDIRIPLRLIKPTYHRNPNLLSQRGVLSCWEYENHLKQMHPQNLLKQLNNIPSEEFVESFSKTFVLVDRTPQDELLKKYVSERDLPVGTLMYKFYLPAAQCHTLYKVLTHLNFGADNLFPGLNGVFQRMKDDALYDPNKFDESLSYSEK